MNDVVVSRANGGVLGWKLLWLQYSIHVLIIAIVLARHRDRRSGWEPVVGHMTNLSLNKISSVVCVCVHVCIHVHVRVHMCVCLLVVAQQPKFFYRKFDEYGKGRVIIRQASDDERRSTTNKPATWGALDHASRTTTVCVCVCVHVCM